MFARPFGITSAAMAISLAADALREAHLHWIPDPAPSYVTARVVAGAGGACARAVPLSTGPDRAVPIGAIPVGGARLPLASHGGSAMFGFGILMGVPVHRDVEFSDPREE